MKILLDIYGCDDGIKNAIESAIIASKEIKNEIILVGNTDEINNYIKETYNKESIEEVNSKLSILHADSFITNNEEPAKAIKNRKDSTLVVAYNYMKEHDNTILVSAGSTGAVMAGALLKLGRIKGIHRPALCTLMPSEGGKTTLFLDSGANPNAKDISILQYALLGKAYAKHVMNKEQVKIALLNIGTEEEKGTPELKEAYRLLKEEIPEFVGNIEARDVARGKVDIIVCDGLVGNVCLKSLEGAVSLMKDELKKTFKLNPYNMLLGMLTKPLIKRSLKRYDFRETGGGVLLGVKKPVVKLHGASDIKAFINGIKQADDIVNSNITEYIKEEIEKYKE